MKKGYKALNADMTCRDVKFKVGKMYETKGTPKLCSEGFHYCLNAFDVYNYYPKHENTVVAEIEDHGDTVTEGDKSATNKIKIVRILSDAEKLKLWIDRNNSGNYNSGDYNSGNYNSGNRNSGNYNSGDYNSGNRNSGDYNSGNRNSGNYNSGNYNSGDYNSGNRNSGNYNSGNYNSGNRNSGNYNSGDYNSGYFNSDVPTVRLFNKDSGLKFDDPKIVRLNNLNVKPILKWVYSSEMTEEEKTNNKSHATTGGFLQSTGRIDWRGLTEDDKTAIRSLPGFDDIIFQTISGISLSDDVEVIVNGVKKTISKEKAKELGLVD